MLLEALIAASCSFSAHRPACVSAARAGAIQTGVNAKVVSFEKEASMKVRDTTINKPVILVGLVLKSCRDRGIVHSIKLNTGTEMITSVGINNSVSLRWRF